MVMYIVDISYNPVIIYFPKFYCGSMSWMGYSSNKIFDSAKFQCIVERKLAKGE